MTEATFSKLVDKTKSYVKEHPGCTFADIQRLLERYIKTEGEYRIGDEAARVVLWTGLSEDAMNVLIATMLEGGAFVAPTSPETYYAQGVQTSGGPIIDIVDYREGEAQQDDEAWLPVTLTSHLVAGTEHLLWNRSSLRGYDGIFAALGLPCSEKDSRPHEEKVAESLRAMWAIWTHPETGIPEKFRHPHGQPDGSWEDSWAQADKPADSSRPILMLLRESTVVRMRDFAGEFTFAVTPTPEGMMLSVFNMDVGEVAELHPDGQLNDEVVALDKIYVKSIVIDEGDRDGKAA